MILVATSIDEAVDLVKARTEPLRVGGALASGSVDSLELRFCSTVLQYEPEETILRVGASFQLSELRELLCSKHQWIPALWERSEETIGAALNAGGMHPREMFSGRLSNTVLGGEYLLSDGTFFRSGSRVVKSVAGYDTHRALVGSRGLLAASISFTLKTYPLPESFVRLLLEPDAPLLRDSSLFPSARFASGNHAYLELAGHAEDVVADMELISRMADAKAIAEDRWEQVVQSEIASTKRTGESLLEDDSFRRLKEQLDPKGVWT